MALSEWIAPMETQTPSLKSLAKPTAIPPSSQEGG